MDEGRRVGRYCTGIQVGSQPNQRNATQRCRCWWWVNLYVGCLCVYVNSLNTICLYIFFSIDFLWLISFGKIALRQHYTTDSRLHPLPHSTSLTRCVVNGHQAVKYVKQIVDGSRTYNTVQHLFEYFLRVVEVQPVRHLQHVVVVLVLLLVEHLQLNLNEE